MADRHNSLNLPKQLKNTINPTLTALLANASPLLIYYHNHIRLHNFEINANMSPFNLFSKLEST